MSPIKDLESTDANVLALSDQRVRHMRYHTFSFTPKLPHETCTHMTATDLTQDVRLCGMIKPWTNLYSGRSRATEIHRTQLCRTHLQYRESTEHAYADQFAYPDMGHFCVRGNAHHDRRSADTNRSACSRAEGQDMTGSITEQT